MSDGNMSRRTVVLKTLGAKRIRRASLKAALCPVELNEPRYPEPKRCNSLKDPRMGFRVRAGEKSSRGRNKGIGDRGILSSNVA